MVKIVSFMVDESKYKYLEPVWKVLENNPKGLTLSQAAKQSGLDETMMANNFQAIAIDFTKIVNLWMVNALGNKTNIFSLVKAVLKGDITDDKMKMELVDSWIFDKMMLMSRIVELDWVSEVAMQDMIGELKKMWLEKRGM